MLYSKTCEYAIRAVAYMASKEDGQYTSTVEVNKATNVPGPYLPKIFRILVKKAILKARQGPGGGVAFVRSPDQIFLLDVIQAIETTDLVVKECVMGLVECSSRHACPMHNEWAEIKTKMVTKLGRISIREVSGSLKKSRFRGLRRVRLTSHVKNVCIKK